MAAAGLGGGEWVGEHQRRVMELAVGSVGREEGRRKKLRGSLRGGGGGHGERRRAFPGRGANGAWLSGSEWRREG